jgi:hypothetical protein
MKGEQIKLWRKGCSTALIGCFAFVYTLCAASPLAFAAGNNNRFGDALTDSTQSVSSQLDTHEVGGLEGGAQGVTSAII